MGRRALLAGHRQEREPKPLTPTYLLRRGRSSAGRHQARSSAVGPDQSIYLSIFARASFLMDHSVAVTFIALLLGLPAGLVAFDAARAARANVRDGARADTVLDLRAWCAWPPGSWCCSTEGLVNTRPDGRSGLIRSAPLALLFNRTGVIHLDGAHPAALHDPAALQRDEEGAAHLLARGGLAAAAIRSPRSGAST